ncbi:MAG: hypothetical protein IPL47_08420 [Phyllobacteriaceae bacterium]|nr:hypothetical protein [Phyllobacteriaceae bacterium]
MMQDHAYASPRTILVLAAAAMAAALIGLGLAGWLDSGARMFMTLAEAGLAWCF